MFTTLLLIIILPLLFYYYLYKPQQYWTDKNVKQGPAIPIFGDNLWLLLKRESLKDMILNVYNRYKDVRYVGLYQTTLPTLMIRDPNLIRQLAIKDFDHFTDHRDFTPSHVDPLWGHNLFALKGDPWRQMRATLSPAFTSSKMKAMFLLMENSARQYVDFYTQQKKDLIDVELRESFMRVATDVIANCAFGFKVNSLKDRENSFYINGRDAFDLSKLSTNLIFWLNTTSPRLASFLNLRLFSKKSTDFFKEITDDTVKYREKNGVIRPDVIHLLMEARKGRLKFDEPSEVQDAGFAAAEEASYNRDTLRKVEFTDTEIAAQLFVFFFAGSDTIATLLSFLCYQLTLHPKVQEKLRKEVDAVCEKTNGVLSYDVLNKMAYLDMCVTEVLRQYPPFPFTDREVTREYTIQPERPDEEPVHLKPGDLIWIPSIALHYDEQYFENPEKFDPDRFSEENKHKIQPYTYIPFGAGPRNCIGSRFALMETKTITFHLLKKFELIVIDKTTIPIKLMKGTASQTIEGGFWIGLKSRNVD